MKEFEGCPGSRMMNFDKAEQEEGSPAGRVRSELRQWPIQLHLVSPAAPYYEGGDVLLTADCVPFAMANFHGDYLKGNTLAIACPKLDQGQDIYVEKIRALVDEAKINTLTVLIMQVPCCRGLLGVTINALQGADRKVPLKCVVVSLQGDVLQEEWVEA